MDVKRQQGAFAPSLLNEMNDGILHPINARAGVYVAVRYFGMKLTDTIHVTWNGKPSDPPEVSGREDFAVAIFQPPTIAPDLNKDIVVQYRVTHEDGTHMSSAPLTFKMGTFEEDQLPVMHLPQVVDVGNDKVLDLTKFEVDVMFQIAQWPMIIKGQTMWIALSGLSQEGHPVKIPAVVGVPVKESDVEASFGVLIWLPRAGFEALKNQDYFTVTCAINFGGGVEEDEAIRFPALKLKLVNAVAGPLKQH
jgi:hypothetical protein